MRKIPAYQKNAILLAVLILCAALLSIGWIGTGLWQSRPDTDSCGSHMTADIYQDGELLTSLPLDAAKEPYSFTVTFGDDGYNEILVADGGIGVASASCPDKLCVHQGFLYSSLLPIVCLPNKLVIQVHEEEAEITPDIIAY